MQCSPRPGKKEEAYTLTSSVPILGAFLKLLQGRFILLELAASLIFGNADFMTVLMSVVKLYLRKGDLGCQKNAQLAELSLKAT